jgi:hypothetical protein
MHVGYIYGYRHEGRWLVGGQFPIIRHSRDLASLRCRLGGNSMGSDRLVIQFS